jgi:hypothetical protein
MSTRTKTSSWPALAAGTTLLGEIITWSCKGPGVRHSDLVRALRDSDLNEAVARELAPRHAFARACRRLAKQRIIRQVSEDASTITFQFTQESKAGDRFEYTLETMLTLDKARGKVSCALPGLATLAQEALDECIAVRTSADITRIVQRLFEREADLFPIREQGGAYFCPQRHTGFVNKVEDFLNHLGRRMNRFPVPAGTWQGDRSVKETVACGIASLIAEHNAAIESFGEDTRPDTLARAAERIQQTKFKIEGYSEYLAEERAHLERDLSVSTERLRVRVEELTADHEPAECAAAG